ncbi:MULTISPECIES: hypothetical protein [Gloeobacter]|uniref:Glr0539 protein n=2 Tax=Gloeobacter TaxID=33071 RepID=Q7NN74_GLOVI|nr:MULTISPECIES: hypothetical protein [Gloeobacter]UFP93380.1 hypothetical protein ISF26_16460 [Gloeobacter morelensis MG652769]BAC88480.1 glr0539 [Gloeobacter violaceus PCC 7421]
MSKGFSAPPNPEKEFSTWFFREYRRLSLSTLNDSLLGEAPSPVEARMKIARELPGCYWLAQQWPRVPNKNTILKLHARGKFESLSDINAFVLRSPEGDEIRRWARDHADPAFACSCC